MATPLVYSQREGRAMRVKRVRIGLLSPDEIRRRAVVSVTEGNLYVHNIPRDGSINDRRMGSVDRRIRCGTCLRTTDDSINPCPGHEGCMELACPVYHVGFIDTVLKILRLVCYHCCEFVLLDPAVADVRQILRSKRASARFNILAKMHARGGGGGGAHAAPKKEKGKQGGVRCRHCGGVQPQWRRVGLDIVADWSRAQFESTAEAEEIRARGVFTAADAQNILRHVRDPTYVLLGFDPKFSRPDSMILEVLVVPPPIIRPSIVKAEGSRTRGQDDLTRKLQAIFHANTALRNWRATHPDQRWPADLVADLQAQVATYFDNSARVNHAIGLSNTLLATRRSEGAVQFSEPNGRRRQTSRSDARMRDVVGRFKGKYGRLRGSLMGKRVNFSARSVISPDPRLRIEEIGVPHDVAKTLTYPERVTALNIRELSERVRNGPDHLVGAKTVIDTSHGENRVVHLEDCAYRDQICLKIGDVVERTLKDGDYGIFNRQPTLHKPSMMGHRVRLMPGRSFRLSLACTPPYNADFDGDEMNFHIVQNEAAKAEVRNLMQVPLQVITAQSNKPCIALVQDALVGAMLLTRCTTFVDRDTFMDLLMQIEKPHASRLPFYQLPRPAILRPRPLWTGKQVFSTLLPRSLNLERKVRGFDGGVADMDVEERHVLVRHGELLTGALCKQTLGTVANGIVHLLFDIEGPWVTADFISDAQNVVNRWLMGRGLSVGMREVATNAETRTKIRGAIDHVYSHLDAIAQLASHTTPDGRLGGLPGVSDAETEGHCVRALNRLMDQAGSIAQQGVHELNNGITALVKAGSKGNPVNMCQIRGLVGQQSVEGHRIFSENGSGRTLPSFRHGDTTPEAHGFVRHSYDVGLTAQEFFFHAMGGREGLVDTAVKTSDTGYMQRRLIKLLESFSVAQDGSVRSSRRDIIQFAYGNDGLDAAHIKKVQCPELLMSDEQLRATRALPAAARVGVDDDDDDDDALACEFAALRELRDRVRQAKRTLMNPLIDTTLCISVNVPMFIESFELESSSAAAATAAAAADDPPLSATWIFQQVNALCRRIRHSAGPLRGCLFLQMSVRANLSIRRLLHTKARHCRADIVALCDRIHASYMRSQVAAGEMVGALAAQCIGEPTSQMTLRTFHFAGVADKNATLGIPWLKQLINASKKITNPIASVSLVPIYAQDSSTVLRAKQLLEHVPLTALMRSQGPWTATDIASTLPSSDEDLVLRMADTFDDNPDRSSTVRSYMRIGLDRSALLERGLTPHHVAHALATTAREILDEPRFGRALAAEENMHPWFVLLEWRDVAPAAAAAADNAADVDCTKRIVSATVVSGFGGVQHAQPTEVRQSVCDPQTGAHSVRCEHMLDVHGRCPLATLLTLPCVDPHRTICNSIHEVLAVLGIEACTLVLFNEIKTALSFDGTYVNDRHIALLVDAMTCKGQLSAANRCGISRMDAGFLVRSSFEETANVLFNAAAHGQHDTVAGVTEHIIFGQLAPIGSGATDVRTIVPPTTSQPPTPPTPPSQHALFVTKVVLSETGRGASASSGPVELLQSDDDTSDGDNGSDHDAFMADLDALEDCCDCSGSVPQQMLVAAPLPTASPRPPSPPPPPPLIQRPSSPCFAAPITQTTPYASSQLHVPAFRPSSPLMMAVGQTSPPLLPPPPPPPTMVYTVNLTTRARDASAAIVADTMPMPPPIAAIVDSAPITTTTPNISNEAAAAPSLYRADGRLDMDLLQSLLDSCKNAVAARSTS